MNIVSDLTCAYFNQAINEEIIKCKRAFYHSHDDHINSPYIPPEIAESWVRSKKYGIDPFAKLENMKRDKRDLFNLSMDNKMLLEAAVPLIEKELSHLFSITGMCLADREGTILFTKEAARNIDRKLNFQIGSLLNETTVGTLSQSMCHKHLKPIQLFGAIHYHSLFENDLSSSVPIFDENKELIGILTLVKSMMENNWDVDLQTISTHLAGWAKSLGYAIESQLKLTMKNHSLTIVNQVLETTISAMDEGIITIDRVGKIQHINKEGIKIFGEPAEKIIGLDIIRFVQNQDLLKKVLESGEHIDDLEINIGNNKFEQRFFLEATPVFGNDGKVEGAVICISSSSKVKKMVAQRGGNQARYVFEDIIGTSKPLIRAIDTAKKVAKIPSNVLLIGESGTGKELFAQSIHNMSRSEGPFIAINCASMPRNLIESELFGYEGGSFTGAERKGRIGKIELAHGGTLFLDEIGDMPLEIQPVLLRVLEEKKVMRLGGNRYIPVDFRLVAATNKDLQQAINEKTFREDLYYRISIFTIKIPPLNVRTEDIEVLSEYFIKEICKRTGQAVKKLNKDALAVLVNYKWPGNVRQLQNAMVYAVNMSTETDLIALDHLPDEIISLKKEPLNSNFNNSIMSVPLKELEKQAIEMTLSDTKFNIGDAAKNLGLSKATLYRRIKEYNISLKE